MIHPSKSLRCIERGFEMSFNEVFLQAMGVEEEFLNGFQYLCKLKAFVLKMVL